jgi:hypothetical protein
VNVDVAEAAPANTRAFIASDAVAITIPDQAGAAPAVEDLGARMIEGVEAKGVKITRTIPAGQIGNDRPIEIVFERWTSEELGLDVMTKRSDPRFAETTYRLTNLQRTEPLPGLFEPPPDYTVEEAGGDMLIQRKMQRRIESK